ncbi:hypothetical protein [Aureibaculum conchae]|uniref:hypothetical protein n=1 Tax=Aureibaculum sp. 2308TA14-22 TaxID=3108392 RepID=UPI003393A1FB
MKYLISGFLLFNLFFVYAQEIEIKFMNQFELTADEFIGVDEFDNIYYIKNNTFYKKDDKKTLSYSNTQLGKITSIDIKNPLKIILFYNDFNTVILLDNKLNELSNRIDFNEALLSKNISLVAGSSNNNLWIYSLDDNTLQTYNYNTKKVTFTSQSLSFSTADFKAKKLVSSYKNCWLIGKNSILQFNEYGTSLNEIEVSDVIDVKLFKENLIYLKDNNLHRLNNDKVTSIALEKEISIESFYINKNEIYIFDGTTIFVFSFLKI